jgi:propionyl-CoA carboxylase alpha chain
MIRAIREYEITGIETTLGFCEFVMKHEAFRSGQFDTKFIEKYFRPENLQTTGDPDEQIIASVLSIDLLNRIRKVDNSSAVENQSSRWKKNRL